MLLLYLNSYALLERCSCLQLQSADADIGRRQPYNVMAMTLFADRSMEWAK